MVDDREYGTGAEDAAAVRDDSRDRKRLVPLLVIIAVTVIVAEPDLVESPSAVAVIVTCVAVPGAVNRPPLDIVPPEACQCTSGLKLPVPRTTAEHCTVPPVVTDPAAHVTATEVMVGCDGGEPEPQPVNAMKTQSASTAANPPRRLIAAPPYASGTSFASPCGRRP